MKKILFCALAALCLMACNQNEPTKKDGETIYSVAGRIYAIDIYNYNAKVGDFIQFYFLNDSIAMYSILEPLNDNTNIETIYNNSRYKQIENSIELCHEKLNTPIHLRSYSDYLVYKGIKYYYTMDVTTHQD